MKKLQCVAGDMVYTSRFARGGKGNAQVKAKIKQAVIGVSCVFLISTLGQLSFALSWLQGS